MSVCTLVRHVVSTCVWGGVLAGTLVYRQDPDLVSQNVGPGLLELLPSETSLALLALFCRCVPARCLGQTRVLVRVDLRSLILQGRTKTRNC